jgi:ABC-2 type transport system permease protein
MSTLTITELKLFLREPILVFFAVAFPPILLVILGSVPAFREPDPNLDGARVIDLYVPIVIAMAIAMMALGSIPQVLATYREKGILRRMATTPVNPVRMLGAQVILAASLAVGMLVLVVVVGRLAFNVDLPRQPGGYLVAFVLAVLAMVALGLFVAAVSPSGRAAGGIGNIAFFPLMFFAGLWTPLDVMPEVLQRIGDLTPLGAGVQAMGDAAAGQWPQLLHLGVMLVWTIAAGAVAARYFRWE